MRNWVYENAKNMIGVRNGRLTVIGVCENSGGVGKHVMLICRCECGKNLFVRKSLITSGRQTSCGCANVQRLINASKKHACYGTRLYRIWNGILGRTKYKVLKDKKNYWGRGIVVCKEWENFENFRDWALQNGYNDTLTIDRINVDGDYCPENCRWATLKEQANNRRNNRLLTYMGDTKSMSDWASSLGISYPCMCNRIRRYGVCHKSFFAGKYRTNGKKI